LSAPRLESALTVSEPTVAPTKDARNPPVAPRSPKRPTRWIALTGNPNCGKTTLFNALTGLSAKVGNYPGVTVERKEGRLRGAPPDLRVSILDLPGTYSLSAQSPDEAIARDVLWQCRQDVPAPDLVIVVVDASNLERNLYFATQVIELGHPTLLALNMVDVAEANGHDVDATALSRALGVPVVPMVASTGQGVPALRDLAIRIVRRSDPEPATPFEIELPPALRTERDHLAAALPSRPGAPPGVRLSQALLLLTDVTASPNGKPNDSLPQQIHQARTRLEAAGLDWHSAAIEARYAKAAKVHALAVDERMGDLDTLSDRIDRWVTHRVWGPVIFILLMAVLFESIFTFAQWPMQALESLTATGGATLARLLPPGQFKDLLVDGVIAGVGAVLVFLPQILLLFLFIGMLEDTGYMARAAFLMDRFMSRVGLHGKSFIPLLSSFACAIPGIMATRTIESPKDRLVTILVAPLMSCSARLPVYALLIAACVPDRRVLGLAGLQGLTLLSMYLLGVLVALAMAWLFKRTFLKGEPPMLILELPPYRRPVLRVVLRHVWDRSKLFLQRAGTVILGASIILWFLLSYPRTESAPTWESSPLAQESISAPTPPGTAEARDAAFAEAAERERAEVAERVRQSYAGRVGRAIEPVIAPLGFDWQIGIGLIASLAAREIFVSTMATVYNVGEVDPSTEGVSTLSDVLREQERPDGSPVYTVRTALTLMVFFVFALQCISTVAIVRRETNSWKWPVFQWLYMGVLAWVFAFATYQLCPLFGIQ
jgi:ferrous iron transport protein B